MNEENNIISGLQTSDPTTPEGIFNMQMTSSMKARDLKKSSKVKGILTDYIEFYFGVYDSLLKKSFENRKIIYTETARGRYIRLECESDKGTMETFMKSDGKEMLGFFQKMDIPYETIIFSKNG